MAGSGNSSMRFIAVHSTLIITYTWMFVCILRREFVDIPMGVIYFAAITIAGKVIQKFPEVSSLNNGNEKKTEEVKKTICDKCGSEIN
jgi:hypothetical protein